MTTFTIFWTSIIAAIFFISRVVLKGIIDFIESILDSLTLILIVGGASGLGCGALFLLLYIKDEGFWVVLGTIVVIVLVVLFVIGVLGGIIATIIEVVGSILVSIFNIVLNILGFAENFCGNQFYNFLGKIRQEIEKI